MSSVIDQARWEGGVVNQVLDTSDDSISYINRETGEQLFVVDSCGYLTNNGEDIGKFCLKDDRWFLKIDGEVFAEAPPNSLSKLPEFELFCVIKLLKSMDK